MSRRFLPFIFLLCGYGTPAAAAESARIEVDFGTPIAVKSMAGFLGSAGPAKPANEMISPIRPQIWRTAAVRRDIKERFRASGARIVYMMSYGFDAKSDWGGLGPPYKDGFKNFDEKWAPHYQELVRSNSGIPIIWDFWNEPNYKANWVGSETQLFETYSRVYKVVRSVDPHAIIGGLSTSTYDKGLLTRFLDYELGAGAEVNFLSWHELNAADTRIPEVQARTDCGLPPLSGSRRCGLRREGMLAGLAERSGLTKRELLE